MQLISPLAGTMVACALAAHAATANAAISATFFDEDDWNAAVDLSTVINETFDAAIPGAVSARTGAPTIGLLITPNLSVTFNAEAGSTDPANSMTIDAGAGPVSLNGTTHLDISLTADVNHPGFITQSAFITIAFPEPVTAVAGDFSSTGDGAGVMIWADGDEFSLEPIGSRNGFAGLTFDEPVTSVQLIWQGTVDDPATERFGFDNIRYAAVPTPGTSACIALAGLIALRRHQRA